MIYVQAEQAAVLTPLPFLQKLYCMRPVLAFFLQNCWGRRQRITKAKFGPRGQDRDFLGTISVPNSSYGFIFVKRRAKDGRYYSKNTGVRRAKLKLL